MTDLMPTNIDQTKVLATLGLNPNDPKAHALMLVCQRYDLDPLLKHIQIVQNQTYVTRDGFLHIAHKSGRFDGMVTEYEKDIPSGFEAKVSVFRKDMSHPFSAVGRSKKNENNAQDMALARAERRALRRAFNVAGISDHEPAEWEQVPDMSTEDGGVQQVALPAPTHHTFDEPDVEFVNESAGGASNPGVAEGIQDGRPTGEPNQPVVSTPSSSARSSDSEPMTNAQRSMLFALIPRDMTREKRLEYVGALIDRDIESSKDLTKEEASTVIDLLQKDEQ